ncbi:DUF421 domain-containing protein [Granulicella cerasi]|uniref:DUF421 domain-containing protein n=1 Tax=Granulicella cerasi TaxID=741063 RepID=A0ABW1Z8R5_9BACT|nr:YetF domain-containing protein [Granulicella cerasi]
MPTIIHAVAGYFILLFIVRVLKRRAGSQMTLFEFVIVFLIGGVIILSTVGNDRSVTNCTCAVIAVGLIHRSLAWVKAKSPTLGAILDGTPLVIIRAGEWQPEIVKGMKLRREDIEAAARSAGVTRIEDIDYAILERNGRISVLPKDS